MRDMQLWLSDMKNKGEKLPDNQTDLLEMFKKSRKINYFDTLKEKKKFRQTNKDYINMIKWGARSSQAVKFRNS